MAKGLIDETAVEKAERLLSAIEADQRIAIAKSGDNPVAKAKALLTEVERSADPAYLAKRATEDKLAKWMAEPLPPKCAGPGLGLAGLDVETIEKLAPSGGLSIDDFRKASQSS